METLFRDLWYGFRVFFKKPGFTAIAIITLALGIGANTAIFSVVNGVLLRPFPYKDPEKIVTLWQSSIQNNVKKEEVAPANFLDWKDQSRVFENIAAIYPYGLDLTGQGEPESFETWLVSEGFFNIVGVEAQYGRTFLPEEYRPGSDLVVLLSYGVWQRRFGSDPGLVGQKLILDDKPYTVVGILPPEFQFPTKRDMWAPKVFDEHDKIVRGSAYINVVARLKPGVTPEQAQSEMDSISARLSQEYPQTNRDMRALVVTLPEQMVGQVRPALMVLLGAVGFLLLIACANVANLLLVRGAERQRELAIRTALGASRRRIVRQLFTESLMLAFLGGLGGILLAGWGIDAIIALSPENLPRIEQVNIDGRVLSFALGASLLTALIFGLIPSLHFSNPNLQETLKEGGQQASAGITRNRLRNFLVVSEIAMALVLLIGAGLLIRSFVGLIRVDPGFQVDKVIALQVFIWDKYKTPEQRVTFFDQAFERILALPGVRAAGAVSALPFLEHSIDTETTFSIQGRPQPSLGQEFAAYSTVATTDFFETMKIPLKGGRLFTRFDKKDSPPVVVINETMARRYWPEEDPIGKTIVVRSFGKPTPREIIGVVGDERHTGLDSDPRPEFFVPHLQNPFGSMTIVVRTNSDPLALLPSLKNEIWAINKDQPFYDIATMEQLVSGSLVERRFHLLLLGTFAAIALLLAGVGIYGLISFSTSQRTHEIGIRMALGAQTSDIMNMILGEGVVLVLIGIAIGLAGALALTRFLKSFLFGITTTDPITYAAISLLLISVALFACYIPARRAMKVDPMVALRHE
jgi:putative ABC transport system permease protein